MRVWGTPEFPMLVCTRCSGQWLTNASSSQLVRGLAPEASDAAWQASAGAGREQRAPARGGAYRAHEPGMNVAFNCPICQTELQRNLVVGTGVMLDVCAAHGTFFDAHEVQSLEEHFLDERAKIDPRLGDIVDAIRARRRGAS